MLAMIMTSLINQVITNFVFLEILITLLKLDQLSHSLYGAEIWDPFHDGTEANCIA